jgi:hypothetical protein
MEVRTYKSDTDLRRAWKQLRNAGRTVKLHKHQVLSLVVGPLTSENVWVHKRYRSSDLVTRALQNYARHRVHAAVRCEDHELCVRVTDADTIINANAIPDRLEPDCRVGKKVMRARGQFRGLCGKVVLKRAGGIVQVHVPLASKPVIIEVPETALRPAGPDNE